VAGDDVAATVGTPVSFDGSQSRPLIGIDSYTWDFGDGSGTASGANVTHTFTTTGTYTVTARTGVEAERGRPRAGSCNGLHAATQQQSAASQECSRG
jgi:hypothetical protein